jgi:HSP20 family protein
MSWDKRSKKWFDVFDDEFDQLFDEMFKYFDEAEVEPEQGGNRKQTPFIYGFSITVGPDGKPLVRKFGNVRRTEQGRIVSEVREPLVEIMDRGGEVVIIAEVPGVKKEDIHIGVKGKEIRLSINTEDRKYEKIMAVPPTADMRTMKMEYNNGILEIRLNKKKS